MERIILQAHKSLIKRNKTVAVAESCTGGLASTLLTRLSGSSKFFILGIVAYSNTAKINLLKIPAEIIKKNGSVSRDTAIQMAQRVRKLAKADFAVGITGIAGPAGGSLEKPVGTVFIAVAVKNKINVKKFCFRGSREKIRKNAALQALKLLTCALSSP